MTIILYIYYTGWQKNNYLMSISTLQYYYIQGVLIEIKNVNNYCNKLYCFNTAKIIAFE